MFHQILADGGGHGQTDVGIHIDLAYAHAGSLAQHVFRHAAGAAHLAAELVAGFHEFLGHAGGAVQHQRIAGQAFADLFQAFEVQLGFALELVGTMAGADGHGQGVAARALHEVHGLVGVGVHMVGIAHMLFHTGQLAQFGFHPDAARVGVFHHLLGQGDVFFIGQVRAVDHHGGETAVDTVAAQFEAGAVVQMHHHGHGRILGQGGFHQLHEVFLPGIAARARRDLKDHGGFFLRGGLHDALHDFHVVDVERAHSIPARIGGGEHFLRPDKRHGFLLH